MLRFIRINIFTFYVDMCLRWCSVGLSKKWRNEMTRNEAVKLVKEFETVCKEYAWKGSKDPRDAADITVEFHEVKSRLIDVLSGEK